MVDLLFSLALTCVSSVHSVFSLCFVKKDHRHITWVGFKPTTFANLEQMSYQLDHRECPVERQFESYILAAGTATIYVKFNI